MGRICVLEVDSSARRVRSVRLQVPRTRDCKIPSVLLGICLMSGVEAWVFMAVIQLLYPSGDLDNKRIIALRHNFLWQVGRLRR